MRTTARNSTIVFLALLLAGCASSPAREGETAGQAQTTTDEAAGAEGKTVLQWIDITNQAGEPVVVSARVGAGEEQRLGLFGPAEYRRVKITTGATSSGEIFLDARNDRTGNHATTRLQVTPSQTLRWDIQF